MTMNNTIHKSRCLIYMANIYLPQGMMLLAQAVHPAISLAGPPLIYQCLYNRNRELSQRTGRSI